MLENIQERITRKTRGTKKERFLYLYLGCILISIFLGLVFKYKYNGFMSKPSLDSVFISNISSVNYSSFFSTSASILSTIVAIIFSLLIFFTQISYQYTSIEIFWNKETLILLISYFSTIALSLVMLETTYQFPVLVLIMTFTCLLLLFPFSMLLIDKLVYEIGVDKLNAEISSLLDSNNESLALGKTASLVTICKRSIKNNRQKDFSKIMMIFMENVNKAKQKKMVDFIEITGLDYLDIVQYLINSKLTTNYKNKMIKNVLNQINEYIKSCFDILKCDDIDLQTNLLKDCGINMIKAKFNEKSINKIIKILVNIFNNVQKKRCMCSEIERLNNELEHDIIEYIGELATELYNCKYEISSLAESVKSLFVIGTKALQIDEVVGGSGSRAPYLVVQELKEIKDNIGADTFLKLVGESSVYIINNKPKLEPYLDKFKEYLQFL
jgi:hypothetical protein